MRRVVQALLLQFGAEQMSEGQTAVPVAIGVRHKDRVAAEAVAVLVLLALIFQVSARESGTES